MLWGREGKYFASQFIWRQNHSKVYEKSFVGGLTITIIPRKAEFIVGYTNFKPQKQPWQVGKNLKSGRELTVRCLDNVDALRDSVGRSLEKSHWRRSQELDLSRALSINFCPCHLVWHFWSDIGLLLFWDTMYIQFLYV